MADDRMPGILVVDDRPDVRALLQTVLRHYGFDVWLAAGGKPAAGLYSRRHEDISLVLLGATADGTGAIATLRALQEIAPQVVACVLAEPAPAAHEADLVAAGVLRVIHTPFDPAALAKLLWGMTGTGDRRTGPRFTRRSTRVAVATGLDEAQIVESRVSDQSPEGLQLQTAARLADVGALLNIRPA